MKTGIFRQLDGKECELHYIYNAFKPMVMEVLFLILGVLLFAFAIYKLVKWYIRKRRELENELT